MDTKRIVALVIGSAILLAGLLSVGQIWENLDANEVMVIQSPVSGELTVYTDQGLKMQWFGKVTKYPRRATYEFRLGKGSNPEQDPGNSKKLRFNDGGHAWMSGSVSWVMPLEKDKIIKIHKAFGSAEGVEQQAVAKMIDSAVYMSGPLMSSTESSGERRAELLNYIEDQATKGVYVTEVKSVVTKENGEERQANVTKIVLEGGVPKRQQGSTLGEFDITLMPMSIEEIKYDAVVENQIKTRQEAITNVQIAQANAKKAQQDAITIAAQGEATAAKAKWEQETIKAKAVTEAQQKLEVAKLAAQEAEQFKREQVLRGEGEAERKRLVMAADGALDQKLQALVEINKAYASAIQNYQGNWVPTINMGSEGKSGNGALDLVQLLTAKAAKDLNQDMSVETKKK